MSKVYKPAKDRNSNVCNNDFHVSHSRGTLTKGSRLEKENKHPLRSSSSTIGGAGLTKSNISTIKKSFNKNFNNTASLSSSVGPNTTIAERTQVLDPLDKTARMNTINTNLNRPDLLKLFDKFGIFPNKHRALIWKFLLGLPCNQNTFDKLVNMGIHHAYEDLYKTYAITSKGLLAKLQRILSCLAYYSPIFSEVEYLPDLVYPFVKLFANDELLCFEVTLSFFLQWGQHFFEYFPNPPITLIQTTEELLKFHEFDLFNYFKRLGLNMVDYVWPFLQSLFTTMLSKDDWLSLVDFLVLYNQEPIYLLLFIVAYLSYFKEPLMKIETLEEIEYFLQKQNAVNIQTILKDMRYYKKNTPLTTITVTFKNSLPLTDNEYPIFNAYPEYSVEHHRKVREQFIKEEKKLETKKERIKQVQTLTEELLEQERKFRDKQEALVKAQNNRKAHLMIEEERRLKQKLELEMESRDARLNQLKNLERAIHSSLKQQDRLSEQELYELERELELQSRIDRQLIQSRLEEEKLLSLEFQAAQRLNEITELRNGEERARRIRTEIDYMERQNRLRDRVWEENLRAEDEEFKLRMNVIRQKKLAELNQQQEINDKKELELKVLGDALEKELKHTDVERERKLRRIAQEGVFANEEYMNLYKKQDENLKDEDEKHMRRVMEEEKRNAIKKTEERLSQLEQEKRLLATELEKYSNTLKERSIAQKREEFQDKVIEVRREKELRLIEEEKNLQKTILDIEEQRRFQREMQQELLEKEREYQEKHLAYRSLRKNEDRLINEEREKFADLRDALKDEQNKLEEVRERMADARLTQIRQQNEEIIQQNVEEMRKKIQSENMLKYYEEDMRGREQASMSRTESSYVEPDQRSYESRSREEDTKFEG